MRTRTSRLTGPSLAVGLVIAFGCGTSGSDSGSSGEERNDNDVLVARSTDGGATWTAPAALNTNGASDLGSDDYPQVAADRRGNWIATWHSTDSLGSTIGGDWDILMARSTDGGVTWTAPAALNANAASDVADDHRPQVTTDGRGVWVAVWEYEDPN
jgi:Neuraminidase (sialidase)